MLLPQAVLADTNSWRSLRRQTKRATPDRVFTQPAPLDTIMTSSSTVFSDSLDIDLTRNDTLMLFAVTPPACSEISKSGFCTAVEQLANRLGCDLVFARWSPDLAGLVASPDQEIVVRREIERAKWLNLNMRQAHLLVSNVE